MPAVALRQLTKRFGADAPALDAFALFAFVDAWKNFHWPLIFVRGIQLTGLK